MNAKAQSLFASGLTVAVGAWVMLVPVFTSLTGGALVSTLIAGGVIALAGLVQIFWENALPSWTSAVVATWLVISTFAFNVSSTVGWNLVIAAIATFLLAAWDGLEVNEMRHAHQHS